MNSLHDRTELLIRIRQLFLEHGQRPYEGARRESITALEHALQTAQLADWAHAPASLVAAAFLHDIGHALAADAVFRNDHVDDAHEELAEPFLSGAFGPEVIEPIRLHVAAKRCLVYLDARYEADLSPASRHSLMLQGGPMTLAEAAEFQRHAFAREALQLRRWDDLAKAPERSTPPLDYYLALLDELPHPDRLAA